jgi:hypothetical protein
MQAPTYEQHPEVVADLKEFGPVIVDDSVPPETVRLSFDVPVQDAPRFAAAVRREEAAIRRAAALRNRHKSQWEWRSGKPNPKLAGPPQD